MLKCFRKTTIVLKFNQQDMKKLSKPNLSALRNKEGNRFKTEYHFTNTSFGRHLNLNALMKTSFGNPPIEENSIIKNESHGNN